MEILMKIKMEIPVTNWKILIREGNYKNRLERNIKISTFPELFLLYMATFTTLLARELKEVSFNALKCEVEGSVIYNVRDQNRRLGESLMSNAVWDGAGGAGWCHAPGGPWTITRDTEDTNMKILRVISERWPSVCSDDTRLAVMGGKCRWFQRGIIDQVLTWCGMWASLAQICVG